MKEKFTEKRNCSMTVYTSEKRKEEIKSMAEKANLNLSTFIVNCVDNYANCENISRKVTKLDNQIQYMTQNFDELSKEEFEKGMCNISKGVHEIAFRREN